MGGSFGRRPEIDPWALPPFEEPFYEDIPPGRYGRPPGRYGMPPPGRYGMPPPPPYSRGGYYPSGGFDDYDPYNEYGYDYEPTDPFESYGGPMRRDPFYGGRYSRGYGPMTTMSPYNYGNFYMGNTTMQMLPLMQRKLNKFQLRQGMGGMGGMGCGCMPMMPCLPSSCCMPMMPCLSSSCCMPSMPCLPSSCCTPMAAPMMAAATPLPCASSPLIQGMYPGSSPCCNNFMSPSSFMSALSTGPMAYRPPPSFQFPSNVGMVMPFPYGAPNPLLTPPSFGGFSPQYNFNGGFSCSCSYCTPSVAPPAISYYPRPVSVPQSYPVPYPVPTPVYNVQQVPVPRPVSVVAPPIVSCDNPGFPTPSGAPLFPSQGGFIQGGVGQPLVMTSNKTSTKQSLLTDELSISKSIDSSRRRKAQQLAASLSYLGLNNHLHTKIISSQIKNHSSFSLSNGKSDWLTSDNLSTLLNKSKHKRYKKSSHRHNHDCIVCKQKRLDKYS